LDKLVECRINDSCKQDQRVGIVIRAIWVFLNSCLQIDQVGVEEQDDDVDEVDAAAKQVERECKLVPLERDDVLQSLALEHVDLFALSAQVHEVDVIIPHVRGSLLRVGVCLFVDVSAQARHDVETILYLVDL